MKPYGQNREEGDDRRDDGELGYGDDNVRLSRRRMKLYLRSSV